MRLGERIKNCRKNAGLSQDKLAELVGVSRQAVAKWEAGQSAPSTENLFRLAEVLGTTVDILLRSEPQSELPSEGEDTASSAEKIYQYFQTQEKNRAAMQKAAQKKNLLAALGIAAAYLLLYLIGQLATAEEGAYSVLGRIFSARSRSYLFGWLLSSNLFWISMALSALPALFGRYRFSLTTLAVFVAGIFAGELFGPYPAGQPYGHGHYGWAIWGGMYLVSIVMGIVREKMARRGIPLKSRRGYIWLAALCVLCIAVVVFVLLGRTDQPDYPPYG